MECWEGECDQLLMSVHPVMHSVKSRGGVVDVRLFGGSSVLLQADGTMEHNRYCAKCLRSFGSISGHHPLPTCRLD